MLTGQLPFRSGTQFNVLTSIVKDPAPDLSSLRPELPDALTQAMRKALAKDPSQRWQTAGEFAAALSRVNEPPPSDTVTLLSATTIGRQARIRRARRVAITVAILLSITAAASVGWRYLPAAETISQEEKQIAVLPLDTAGQDENLRALADGLVETITTKLTQIEELQGKLMVVPASEIRSHKITSAEAARRIYGTNLVITGSARRWGNQIQVTLNLVDAKKMRQIAARTLEFESSDPIAMRNGYVNEVIRLLTLRVSPAESTAMSSGETSLPGAYTEYEGRRLSGPA